jgi:hypothetical protein
MAFGTHDSVGIPRIYILSYADIFKSFTSGIARRV